MPATPPFPAPARNSNGSVKPAPADAEFYDDELPPELSDRDEDMEDLQAFIHAAAIRDDAY
jgi:hypothetical protein